MPALPLFTEVPGWQFSLLLLLDLVLMFVVVPAFGAGDVRRDLLLLCQFGVAAVAVVLIAEAHWLRGAIAASFAVPVLTRLLPGLLPQAASLAMVLGFNLLVTAVTARAVFGAGEVNNHRIAGAVFIYLNIGVVFSLAFSALLLADPHAIGGVSERRSSRASELVHLSITTLTSIGGAPVEIRSPVGRSLADLEAVIGQLFPAILLSRLVGLTLLRHRG